MERCGCVDVYSSAFRPLQATYFDAATQVPQGESGGVEGEGASSSTERVLVKVGLCVHVCVLCVFVWGRRGK